MGKMVECGKVDPSSGCTHVIHGNDEADVMKKATEHVKEHGLKSMTPELQAKVRSSMEDE